MVEAFQFLAAEAAHRNETPFYVLGVAFGVYAIVLGTLGMRRPSFAAGRGAGTALIATSVLLAVACGAAIIYVLNP